MKFIHISDLHFHRNTKDNNKIDKLLKTINDTYPEHKLIVTGDISDDGTPWQYDNALKALEPFRGRVFIAPGNHDFGAKGNFYSEERARRFDAMLSVPLQQGGTFMGDNTPVVNIEEDGDARVMLIALDTNCETDHIFDFACGEVGAAQLGVLNTILSDPSSADYVRLLFFHHHPFEHRNPLVILLDARDLMKGVYGRVDVLLFGHMHASEIWPNCDGIKYILASDNSPETQKAREIIIKGKNIEVNPLDMRLPAKKKKTLRGKRVKGV